MHMGNKDGLDARYTEPAAPKRQLAPFATIDDKELPPYRKCLTGRAVAQCGQSTPRA